MASDIITSIVTGGTNNHATTSEEANAVATDFVTQGVNGAITNTGGVSPATGSFAVNQSGTPAMTVDVSLGTAYITATPSGQASQTLRAKMASNYTAYAITANTSGSTKYDWIYLKLDADKAATPGAAADDVTSLYTSRSTSNSSDDGTPPTYGVVLAVVTVANGASSIVDANISDKRTQSYLNNTDDSITPDMAPDLAKAVNRQDNTTNSVVTDQLVQYGWGKITGDNTNRALFESVTFPVAYDSLPVVITSTVGAITGTADTIDDFNVAPSIVGLAYNISVSGFTAGIRRVSNDGNDPGVLGSNADYSYVWIAIGTKAR